MRTLEQAHAMLTEADPQTAITKHYLYTAMRSGAIPTVRAGNKRLVNYDRLLEILANPLPQQEQPDEPSGKIRRIG